MGECSPYPKGRNPLNNKPRRRWEKVLTLKEEILSQQHTKGKVPLILKEEMLSQQTKGKTGEGSLYPKGRNTLSTTNQGEGSPYPKERKPLSTKKQGEEGRMFSLSYRKKSSLNNKPRRRWKKVLNLKEEILSTTNQGEGSPYPKGRNPLSTTKQGEGRMFSVS